jgi:tRNA pseudouridine38-40 synthase
MKCADQIDCTRYRLEVAYDGTDLSGWQVQPQRTTVQGELERVLLELCGRAVRVEASGRTDAGVHARGQVAHLDWPAVPMPPPRLMRALNALLPDAIRVLRVRRVAADFHARFSARGKEYRYFIDNAPVRMPVDRLYRAWIREPLDVAAMQAAALALVGCHDFAAFAANPNREIDGTTRTLHELRVTRRGTLITIRARGDGFLYKMVRSLAGYLIRVGRGEVAPDEARTILASRIRTARVPTAPPEGLFLWRVYY